MLSACASIQTGRDFDVLKFESKIERGVSTQAQVRSWLGEPASKGVVVSTGGERYDEWIYYFASGKLSDMSGAKTKLLQIKFDRQGIVRGYNWSTSAD